MRKPFISSTMTSNEESFNCVFCKETFDNKEELQEHFRKHGDPKFNHSMRRASESEASGEKSAESDVVSCDVCSDTFPSVSKAITHKHKVHPDHDAKYFCPWCGKLFTMKHLYNKHVETSHSSKMQYESNGFHCDYCEADFFVPSAMVYHNKFFHRQDTELAAIGQSRKLKLFNQEMLPLYYCPFCGEEYLNKVNLHKHMGDDHSDENQSPDDVLRCPLCEAIFYHLDAYELHLTFHSTEDTYSEENEIVKNITEFSLEAVPPIMEKVENEATADSEATLNSIGIGDFLQLGMDESIDNESGEKRKKKKKHKKSKKAAITLDEFLNMNKDVFGEGIDVEGIEEVPTQMVAKRLKRLPPKPKPPTKMMPSKELEKLKRQGIVIKKKPGNIPKFNSIKTLKGITSAKPLNISQNSISKKDVMDKINPANDVLSKLLGQGNCQLKIVKKPVQVSNPESKQPNSVEDDTRLTEKESKQDNSDDHDLSKSSQNEEISRSERKELKTTSDHSNGTLHKDALMLDSLVKQDDNNKTTEKYHDVNKNGVEKHENIIEHVDEVNKQTEKNPRCTNKTTGDTKTSLVSLKDSAEENETAFSDKDDSQINFNTRESHENKIDTNKKSIDTLKNLSHLTIKPLNQPKLSMLHLTKGDDKGCCESEDTDETVKFKPGNCLINKQEPVQKPKNDDSKLEALKLLNKNITVKTSNQPVQPNKNTSKDIQQLRMESEKLKTDDSTNKQEQPKKIKEDKNLEALKLLSKNITIKSPNQSAHPNVRNDINQDKGDEDGSEELLSENDQETLQKPKENKNFEALKLLSKNIIVKSSSQQTQPNIGIDVNKDKDDESGSEELLSEENQEPLQKPKEDKNLEALKLLSKNITIKSQNQQVQAKKYVSSGSEQEIHEGQDIKTATKKQFINSSQSKSQENMKSTTNCSPVAKNTVIKNLSTNNHPINTSFLGKGIANSNESRNNNFKESSDEKQLVKTQNCDILKQLPNITTKHVPKISQQITSSVSKSSTVISNKEGTIVKSFMKMEAHKGIETFNVDDSDDEELMNSSNTLNNTINKPLKISSLASNPPHTDKLKSIGQEMTFKTTSRQNPAQSSSSLLESFEDSDYDETNANSVKTSNIISNERKQYNAEHAKNNALRNKLQNLSKHITVKSNTSSTSITPMRIKINQNTENDDSDTEIGPPKVKISELPDDFNDDEESDEFNDTEPSNCIVESPKQLSENEDNDEDNIELHMKPNTSQMPIGVSKKSLLNNLFSKDITIKSSGTKGNFDSEDEYESPHVMDSHIKSDVNKDISLPPQANIPSKNMARSYNQLVRASDIEHNTANTEVIVKKIGSQTVIEEITTTVTKTIRTVNQTVQQEVTSLSKVNSPRPQRIQNMVPRQQVWQGKQIRQATPTIGTKVRNITPQVRSIRPTNQIVSVRPGLNIRPTNPRMTVPKRPTSTTTSNTKQPVVGKPLRISPHVLSTSNKRPTSEDSNGPFSCFKKQKESLIPMEDLPEISQGDTSVVYASSHMSKSHVSNTTKIMKGNSVVSSSQIKSEIKASSEQVNRLPNMSGLKVVKTTSTKQASRVDECEMSTPRTQSTLDAIERLKKQGLLIKKPRLDDNFSENSNSDDNF